MGRLCVCRYWLVCSPRAVKRPPAIVRRLASAQVRQRQVRQRQVPDCSHPEGDHARVLEVGPRRRRARRPRGRQRRGDLERPRPRKRPRRSGQRRAGLHHASSVQRVGARQAARFADARSTRLKRPKAAGIPTVIFDSGLDDHTGLRPATWRRITTSRRGALAARQLGKVLGGKGNVAVLRYNPGSESTEQRERGYLETLAKEFSQHQSHQPPIRFSGNDA